MFKKLIQRLALSLYNIEKTTTSQKNVIENVPISEERRHTQGTLADSLKHGELTEDVERLRWRTYKILKQVNNVKSEITGYDEDGFPITETKKINNKSLLNKIKVDGFDKFPLEMVVDNSDITIGGDEVIDNENIEILETVKLNYDENGEVTSATHGEIDFDKYLATIKTKKPIIIERENLSKFPIEVYTKKLNIRKISESKKLLEFYISKYPDEYNRTSRLFLSELKKIIENNFKSDILEFKSVYFISDKTIGSYDFLEYKYEDIIFDKIVEFNGNYIIKFKANVVIDGNDITEEFKKVELEEKYNKKEAKKQ